MFRLKTVSMLALLALLAWVPSAMADVETYSFQCITNNNTNDCNLAEAQLSLEVTFDGALDTVTFKILNNDPPGAQMTVEQFFIQDLDNLLVLASASITNGTGVVFVVDSNPGNLPGGNSIGFITESSASATPPPTQDGVNPGEWVSVQFSLASATTSWNDLLQSIADSDLWMGVHVINYVSGGSESLVNNGNPVPLPMAGLGGLVLLGGLAAGRIRRTRHLEI
jgi:hypothetical protein